MMRSLLIVAALLAGGTALLVFAFAGGEAESQDAAVAGDGRSQQNSVGGARRQQGIGATESDQNAGTALIANQSAGKKMLLDVARRLSRSEPFEARLRYRINLLDQRISGPGVYYQSGKGGNKAKIVFQSGTANPEMLFEQYTDGRLFYTHYQMPGEERLEFIDLDRVKELPQDHNSFMPGLSAWVAGGGLGGLLEHVAYQFHLGQPQQTTVDDRTLTTVSGDWKPEALTRLYEGQVDKDRFTRDDWWKYLPTHLPHRVSVTICEKPPVGVFPCRIEFSKYQSQSGRVTNEVVMSIEFIRVRHQPDMPNETFDVLSDDLQSVDVTENYVKRVRQLMRIR